jgi:DNA-binding NtrC family response regulator
MKKLHILLVEKSENQIEFFTDALSESGLGFICNTARSIEQAFKILKNSIPDAVFVDVSISGAQTMSKLKKMKSAQSSLIFYSTVPGTTLKQTASVSNYVQLPGSTETMANILKNFFNDAYKS